MFKTCNFFKRHITLKKTVNDLLLRNRLKIGVFFVYIGTDVY